MYNFNKYFKENVHQIDKEKLLNINQVLFSIQKQKVELLCKAIKLYIKIMAHIINSFENLKFLENDILIKIKFF